MRLAIAVILIAGATPCCLRAQSTRTRRPDPATTPAPTPAPKPAPAPSPAPTSKPTAAPTREATTAPKLAGTESHTSLGLRISTLGVGAEISHLLNDHIGVRASANYLTVNRRVLEEDRGINNSQDDVNWDFRLKGAAFSGLLDWYPGRRGVFRFSAGVVTNPLKGTGLGVITKDSTHDLSSTVYRPASIVGDYIASAKYSSVLPYLGFGFGTPASQRHGLGFICDIGAAIGRPTLAFTSTTAATTTNPTLRRDLAAKQAAYQTETLDRIPVYPIVSLGVAYRF